MKWRNVLGVICDRKVPLKLKEKFSDEFLVIKRQQEHKFNVAEMKMLHWMNKHTNQDRTNNEGNGEKMKRW